MKAISAKPETVREVFSRKYVIPNFQRPYSWESEHCDKLWSDILDFYNDSARDEKYFLGNIVINPSHREAQDELEVVDGQQHV